MHSDVYFRLVFITTCTEAPCANKDIKQNRVDFMLIFKKKLGWCWVSFPDNYLSGYWAKISHQCCVVSYAEGLTLLDGAVGDSLQNIFCYAGW